MPRAKVIRGCRLAIEVAGACPNGEALKNVLIIRHPSVNFIQITTGTLTTHPFVYLQSCGSNLVHNTVRKLLRDRLGIPVASISSFQLPPSLCVYEWGIFRSQNGKAKDVSETHHRGRQLETAEQLAVMRREIDELKRNSGAKMVINNSIINCNDYNTTFVHNVTYNVNAFGDESSESLMTWELKRAILRGVAESRSVERSVSSTEDAKTAGFSKFLGELIRMIHSKEENRNIRLTTSGAETFRGEEGWMKVTDQQRLIYDARRYPNVIHQVLTRHPRGQLCPTDPSGMINIDRSRRFDERLNVFFVSTDPVNGEVTPLAPDVPLAVLRKNFGELIDKYMAGLSEDDFEGAVREAYRAVSLETYRDPKSVEELIQGWRADVLVNKEVVEALV